MKSFDKKFNNITSSNYSPKDFIIADAKDADMAAGIRATGFIRKNNGEPTKEPAPYANYLTKIEEMTNSSLVDIMLMSMTSAERLSNNEIFKTSKVTPAVRLNDTSCIWGLIRHGEYYKEIIIKNNSTQSKIYRNIFITKYLPNIKLIIKLNKS